MNGTELQLIMSALENHRRSQKADLDEFKKEMRCEVGKQAELVQAHEGRFQAFDTLVHAGKAIAAGVGLFAGAVWAVFTFLWGK